HLVTDALRSDLHLLPLSLSLPLFFVSCSVDPPALPSFPTRRSSDLCRSPVPPASAAPGHLPCRATGPGTLPVHPRRPFETSAGRSEERRVGKEWRTPRRPHDLQRDIPCKTDPAQPARRPRSCPGASA